MSQPGLPEPVTDYFKDLAEYALRLKRHDANACVEGATQNEACHRHTISRAKLTAAAASVAAERIGWAAVESAIANAPSVGLLTYFEFSTYDGVDFDVKVFGGANDKLVQDIILPVLDEPGSDGPEDARGRVADVLRMGTVLLIRRVLRSRT